MAFMDYIRSLMAVKEDPIEPSVDKVSKDKQRELRCGTNRVYPRSHALVQPLVRYAGPQ